MKGLLVAAAILAVQPLPIGWRMLVDNDPSWATRLDGHAVVGAAFLSATTLSGMISIRPEPSRSCASLNGPLAMQLAVTLYENGRMRTVQLPASTLRALDSSQTGD